MRCSSPHFNAWSGATMLLVALLAVASAAAAVDSVRVAQQQIDAYRDEIVEGIERHRLHAEAKRRQNLLHRDAALRKIPGFWKRVFLSHPSSPMWLRGPADKAILEHLVAIKVSPLRNADGIRVEFELSPNDYIADDTLLLWREFRDIDQGLDFPQDHTSGVDWKDFDGKEESKLDSFFNYFTLHHITPMSLHEFNRVLQDDIYPHPFRFYDRN
jgi:hypothetical protein